MIDPVICDKLSLFGHLPDLCRRRADYRRAFVAKAVADGKLDRHDIPLVDADPSMEQAIANAALAWSKVEADRFRKVPMAVLERRHQQCKTCDYYVPEHDACRHKSCGCPLVNGAAWSPLDGKLQYAALRCPIGRWETWDETWPKRFDHTTLFPGAPGLRFNSSLIDDRQDGYLLAWRTGWAGSDIYVGRLTADLEPVGHAVRLNLRHSLANYGREDPRLFWFRDQLHVAFIGVDGRGAGTIATHQLYASLSDTLGVKSVYAPRYPNRQPWEKNWQFFEHAGELFAVYTISPFRVLRIDGNRASLVAESPWSPAWSGGHLRGGAPPVLLDGVYWSFFHGAHENFGHRMYSMGLATFAAEPPFTPIASTPEPLRWADMGTKPADQYCPVIFPAGAVYRPAERDWLISCGVHDRWTEIMRVGMMECRSALQPGP